MNPLFSAESLGFASGSPMDVMVSPASPGQAERARPGQVDHMDRRLRRLEMEKIVLEEQVRVIEAANAPFDFGDADDITDYGTDDAIVDGGNAAGQPHEEADEPVVASPDDDDRITRTAGVTLSGHRAVFITDANQAEYADPASALTRLPVGITLGAATAGQPVAIQIEGVVTEPSWNWVVGPVFLGSAGLLTQTLPESGASVIVGRAVGPQSLRVDPQVVAILED